MKTLSLEEVLYIHELTIEKHGGSRGIKNLGLVESSLNSGIVTFDVEDLYPSIEEKI